MLKLESNKASAFTVTLSALKRNTKRQTLLMEAPFLPRDIPSRESLLTEEMPAIAVGLL